jgi:hypothetical protein
VNCSLLPARGHGVTRTPSEPKYRARNPPLKTLGNQVQGPWWLDESEPRNPTRLAGCDRSGYLVPLYYCLRRTSESEKLNHPRQLCGQKVWERCCEVRCGVSNRRILSTALLNSEVPLLLSHVYPAGRSDWRRRGPNVCASCRHVLLAQTVYPLPRTYFYVRHLAGGISRGQDHYTRPQGAIVGVCTAYTSGEQEMAAE